MRVLRSGVGWWHKSFGTDERLDAHFAWTPSLKVMKLLRFLAAERDLANMVLGVKGVFVYGAMGRNLYIELPCQDQRNRDGGTMGKLKKAMHVRGPGCASEMG